MNCTYRSIWNDSTGTFVAVSEDAKSAGKKTSSCNSATAAGACFTLQALAISVALSFGGNAIALPAGGVVAAGGASISTVAGSTTINQSTQNAAINWQSFNISSGEAVRFVQPNSNSVILNRVVGADPSNILGSLTANGKVFLVNPNGILFGKGASVNVGGLVASTLNIADSDFMAGNYKFSGAGNGTVLNQGSINADGGYVALLGANVGNDGVIAAQLGTVALAAGNAITLDVAGDGLLNVTVNQGAVNALVQNGGLIQADGGQVLLTAQAAGSLISTVVNNTGVIRAQTLVTGKDGSIKLMGDMQSGTVNVGGTLDASAPNGGNGGFIETSAAHVMIASDVKVSTAAPTGLTGTWLIDPQDFTIGSVATDNISGATLSALLVTNSVVITTATGPRTDVAGTPPVSTLNTATPGNGDINVNEAVSWTATPSTTTLSLNAARDVNVNAAITATNGNLVVCCGRDANVKAAISTTNGSVLLSAGHNINLDPVAAITTTDGNIAMGAGHDINVGAKMTLTRGSSIPSQSLGLPLGLTLSAGNDGVAGGTVIFAPGVPPATVAGPNAPVTINYSPVSYATPTNYSTNFTLSLGSTLTQHMLVSVQGNDKVYDGNTTATLSFKGDPTVGGTKQVTLDAGAGATATFYDKNAASNIGITYSGYSLGGTDAGLFALPVFYCTTVPGRTSANITPAPLTLKASDATKVYGQTFAPLGTAFTVPVLPVAGETVTSVVETSTGSAPTASVAGSAYPIVITPGSATGTNFNQANYVITYQPGALTVTPLPVVVPPVETTPVETKPVATPPELPYEAPIVRPGVGAPTWMPVVVPPGTPPQLLTLAPPVPPIVVAPVLVVEQPPVIAPPESPPSIYVAPHRPRKQDRN
jgi:filamentous hemagglutinin family protein